MSNDTIHEAVRERYAAIAISPVTSADCCSPDASGGSCCGDNAGIYDAALLEGLPMDVTGLSLGCGDPVTVASLKPGETVLDLGSGGGIDCFMAARQVGTQGHVIGVDMTPEMIAKARANADKLGMDSDHVEFRFGQIEALPVQDNSVDVIMSNCVINLSPDKATVFKEARRVLKPGGRISVSDIVSVGELSDQMRGNMVQWAECISGAIDMNDYVGLMKDAGLTDITVVDKVSAAPILNLAPGFPRILSARITARKPQVA